MWLKRVSYFERLDICVFLIIIIDITFNIYTKLS